MSTDPAPEDPAATAPIGRRGGDAPAAATRQPAANVLLLLSAILLLVAALTLLGGWIAHRSLSLPLAALLSGVVLLGVAGRLLRDGSVVVEVLSAALSLPLLMFGLGMLLRSLQGKPAPSPALAAALLLAGAAGVYLARRLARRRRNARKPLAGAPR